MEADKNYLKKIVFFKVKNSNFLKYYLIIKPKTPPSKEPSHTLKTRALYDRIPEPASLDPLQITYLNIPGTPRLSATEHGEKLKLEPPHAGHMALLSLSLSRAVHTLPIRKPRNERRDKRKRVNRD